jgi:hypothetical protein
MSGSSQTSRPALLEGWYYKDGRKSQLASFSLLAWLASSARNACQLLHERLLGVLPHHVAVGVAQC